MELSEMENESAYELFLRGEEFLRKRNPARAALVLERARNQEPDRPSIREALGRAYFNSGRYLSAAEQFEVVVELYPTNSYAHYCLGRCLQKLGRSIHSRRHLRLAEAMGYRETG